MLRSSSQSSLLSEVRCSHLPPIFHVGQAIGPSSSCPSGVQWRGALNSAAPSKSDSRVTLTAIRRTSNDRLQPFREPPDRHEPRGSFRGAVEKTRLSPGSGAKADAFVL